MRHPFITDPKADKNELGEGLGEILLQSHALINHICEKVEGDIDAQDAQLLWTLNNMIDQAHELSESLGL